MIDEKLEYKCLRCGAPIEFYYDPNVAAKKDTKILLIKPCPTCLQNQADAAYCSGRTEGYHEHRHQVCGQDMGN